MTAVKAASCPARAEAMTAGKAASSRTRTPERGSVRLLPHRGCQAAKGHEGARITSLNFGIPLAKWARPLVGPVLGPYASEAYSSTHRHRHRHRLSPLRVTRYRDSRRSTRLKHGARAHISCNCLLVTDRGRHGMHRHASPSSPLSCRVRRSSVCVSHANVSRGPTELCQLTWPAGTSHARAPREGHVSISMGVAPRA